MSTIHAPIITINQGSLTTPKNTSGPQKIKIVPTKKEIDQIPPLDFMGENVGVAEFSFTEYQEKLNEGEFLKLGKSDKTASFL